MSSKNVRNEKVHFLKILTEGLFEDELKNKKELVNTKVQEGSSIDSCLVDVDGIAFEKTFTYVGYKQQPKGIENPKICCLNIELEWKNIIKEKLDDIIIRSGESIVLSDLPIGGDYASQDFAKNGIFSAQRVQDLESIVKAFGGKITTSTKYISLGQFILKDLKE